MSSFINSIWSVLDPFAEGHQLPLPAQDRYHELQPAPQHHRPLPDQGRGSQYLYLGQQYVRPWPPPLRDLTIDISNTQIQSLHQSPQYQSATRHDNDENPGGCLSARNVARARRRWKPLQWHKGLVDEAETHARYLANIDTLQRSQAGDRGETIRRFGGDISLGKAVRSWLADGRYHRGEIVDVDGDLGWVYYCKSLQQLHGTSRADDAGSSGALAWHDSRGDG